MKKEEVLERAIEFLEKKAGYSFHKLKDIKLEKGVWVIRFNVGILKKATVEMKMDEKTGELIEFEKLQGGENE